VCEKHFRKTEFRWEASAFHEKTGRHLSYCLKVQRLLPGVVPSQMSNCPDHLSGSVLKPNEGLKCKKSLPTGSHWSNSIRNRHVLKIFY